MIIVTSKYPPEVKIRALKREVAMRQRVYPHQVSHKKMTQVEAEFEIEVMRAILKDYEESIKKDREPYCPFCKIRHEGGDVCMGHHP
jgi:hypothetical protein